MNPLSICNRIKFELVELSVGEKLKLSGIQIITVVSGKIKEPIKGVLRTFESSVYNGGDDFTAEENSLLSVFSISELDKLRKALTTGEFDSTLSQREGGNGIGTQGMAEVLKNLGGTVEVYSNSDNNIGDTGTTYKLYIPITTLSQ